MKKTVITLQFILVFLSIGFFFLIITSFLFPSPHVITIKIENRTETDIGSLVITHTNSKSDIRLPTVKANDTITYEIDIRETANDEFNEGSMDIHYQESSETIVGYFGRGYGGKVEVFINSIDENDHLNLHIKNNVK